MSKETYRPLPNSVTIKESSIHGLGIFATQLLEPSARLGRTHVDWEGHLIRTPLGGFINHSEKPNAFILQHINYREALIQRRLAYEAKMKEAHTTPIRNYFRR